MITVLLVDDHPVVIEGLRKLLDTAGDIDVTGEAHDAFAAMNQSQKLSPDVVLMDLRMPGVNGIQATRRLRDQGYEGAVIVLTSYGDRAYVTEALEAGADGYLLKNTPAEQLIQSIRDASRGRKQLSPELLDGVLEEFGGMARERTLRQTDLTDEELDILRLASQGMTNRQIAMNLGKTEMTVKKRLHTTFNKLGAVDRAHAVAEGIRRGLI